MTLTYVNATRAPTPGAVISRFTVLVGTGNDNETTAEDVDLNVDGLLGRQQYFGDILQWAVRNEGPNTLNERLSAALSGQKSK
jgi:hypothetical protein